MFGGQKRKPFTWGEIPPKWFMKEIAKAFHLMGQNHEAIHAVDVSDEWTVIISICPRDQADALGQEFAASFERRFPIIPDPVKGTES